LGEAEKVIHKGVDVEEDLIFWLKIVDPHTQPVGPQPQFSRHQPLSKSL
jgi:hypothetical protein